LHRAIAREHVARADATRAKEEALRLADEAQEAQRRIDKLIESLPTAIVAVDRDGTITFANAPTEHLFG
jgi:PAS domain-containing protein